MPARAAQKEQRARGRSTLPRPTSEKHLRRDHHLRSAGVVALIAFVLLGASGLLGVRSATVSATGDGYQLTVSYPAVARPGLAVGWVLRLHHAGGFQEPIHITTTLGYFDLFDFNNLQAYPSAIGNEGVDTLWTFDPPVGDTLLVHLDARLAPAVQKGKTATTAFLIGGSPVVSVRYQTRVMP
jgi:hypothetical protein